MGSLISAPFVAPGLRVAAAATLGLCWGADARLLALLPAFMWLWGRAATRPEAGAAALAYYCVSARGIAAAAEGFWQVSRLEGLLLTLAVSALLAAPWGALWSPTLRTCPRARLVRGPAALLVALIPGYAAISVASPLTSAGALLPGFGWLGLVYVAWLGADIAARPACQLSWAGLAAFALLSGTVPALDTPGAPDGWSGAQTQLATPRGDRDYLAQGRVAADAMGSIDRTSSVSVLPEGAGGTWTEAMQSLWWLEDLRATKAGRLVGIGALVPAGEQYDSALVWLGEGAPAAYLQRYPVPGAMWRPWSPARSVRAHWGGSGTTTVGGEVAGVLVCFEQMLVAPALGSVLDGATALVAVSNTRWMRGSNVLSSQRAAVSSWARLFGLPLVRADNV